MKLNDEERQIMVSLEYEKAMSFLEQAERIAGEQAVLFNIPCSVGPFNKRRA